jgi:hypothetical protein
MSDIFNDGEVLGAFITMALIVIPLVAIHLWDMRPKGGGTKRG